MLLMQRIISILSIFLLFTGFLFANNPGDIAVDSFEEMPGRGLVIRTNPSGARVFINGAERGVTPAAFDSLTPGEYSVRLVKDGFLEREFDIVIFAASRLVASIKMEQPQGHIQLTVSKVDSYDSLPFNPQVSVSSIGSVALDSGNSAGLILPLGYHTIRVRAFGWEDATVVVFADEGLAPVNIIMNPALFKIGNLTQSRSRFNPMNKGQFGKTDYRFDVSAPGVVFVTIKNNDGQIVFSKQIDINTRVQYFSWDGKDENGNLLTAGIYTVLFQAQNEQIELKTEIDFSYDIYPVSLTGGIGGLVFSPLPTVLPSGSYQIEANVVYTNFDSFTGFPFEIGLRLSPFINFEAITVFNIKPENDNTGWGLTGSIKYKFLYGIDFPVSFAALASYSWASNGGEHPLSPGRGAGIYLPVSLELSFFYIVFSPGVFLHGPEGLTPALLLSAGVLYHTSRINAGISARYEIDFKDDKQRFFAGAEARIFPILSNFYFSLQAGMWTQDSITVGYGGLGLGLIF